jgi:hypothetical protein
MVAHACNARYLEDGSGGSQFEACHGKKKKKKVHETPISVNKKPGGLAQVVEGLPGKHKF